MDSLCLLLILGTILSSHHPVLADDDDSGENYNSSTVDCKFAQLLAAQPEVKRLAFVHKNYPRDDCVHWKIAASRSSEIVEVHVPQAQSKVDVTCEGYLKLFDDDSEVAVVSKKWSENTRFLTDGSDLNIYFRSGNCLKEFIIEYRSVLKRELTNKDRYENGDENDNGNDDEEIKSTKIGTIVGTVVGLVLAVLLIGLMFVLVRRCVKQNRSRNRTLRDENVTVHFWSKPSGYTQPTEIAATSSTDVPGAFHSQPAVVSKKFHSSGMDDTNVSSHGIRLPPPGSSMSPITPPPYPGKENGLGRQHPINATNELTHLSEEPPPSYTDVVHQH